MAIEETSKVTYREEHAALSDHRIVALGESLDESVGVGLRSSLNHPPTFILRRLVLVVRPKETMLDVTSDGGGEKCGLLRDEADLSAKPADVEIFDLDPVELATAADGVAGDEAK